jgi:hypothetical protein
MMTNAVGDVALNLSSAGIWFDENGLRKVLEQRSTA